MSPATSSPTRTTDAPPNGEPRPRAPRERLRLRPAPRERRIPWILLGVLLVTGSGLAFSVWASGVGDRQPVLALATSIEAGETVTAGHLTEVRVGSDSSIRTVPAHRARDLIGLVALFDLAPGTIITPEQFTEGSRLAAGEAVVGVSLEPGAAPVPGLRAGDPLLLVRTPAPEGLVAEPEAPNAVWWAEVFDVSRPDDPDAVALGTTVVSVKVAEQYAPDIATASATGRLRLVLVSAIGPLAEIPDLDFLAGLLATPPPEAAP